MPTPVTSLPPQQTGQLTNLASPPAANAILRYGLSYVLVACLGFVILDACNRIRPANNLACPERSMAWWATKQFQTAPQKPELVLLGSSLMFAAQNDCDATYFNKTFDAVTHYRSDYLESQLKQTTGTNVRTASFVIGGQMATDAYAITSTLLSKQNAPATIVWGIAPRDFLDATFEHPEETETVRLMSRIANNENILHQSKVPFWKSVESFMNRCSSLYGRRAQWRAWQRNIAERSLRLLAPNYYFPDSPAPSWLLRQASLSLPEDSRLRQWIVTPIRKKGVEHKDVQGEYRQRYQPFRPQLFESQLGYYESVLEQAEAQGSRLIIVNMPLTKANLDLLPAGVYRTYLSRVRALAASHKTLFLDLNDGKTFLPSDFADPVHLNGYGAIKFMDKVAKTITASKEP